MTLSHVLLPLLPKNSKKTNSTHGNLSKVTATFQTTLCLKKTSPTFSPVTWIPLNRF